MDEFRAEALAREGRPTGMPQRAIGIVAYLDRSSGGADLGVLARRGAVAFANHRRRDERATVATEEGHGLKPDRNREGDRDGMARNRNPRWSKR